MKQTELNSLLESLISTWENEVVEFKQAANDFKTDEIGRYFSALANEANLRSISSAWLVFGVTDKSREVSGTNYRPDPDRLEGTKMQISQDTSPNITFRNIHELQHIDGRVILFEIPAAPRGIPIAWKGHYYARSGGSLTSLGLDKQDQIRQQTLPLDWTAQIVPKATIDDLDEAAIIKAREGYALKHANRHSAQEIMNWPLPTFLDRVNLTENGKLTRSAILLLGKEQASTLLSPHIAQITWKLMEEERAYQHFSTPFILSSVALYHKIRNYHVRILPENQLVGLDVPKYERLIVLEVLHNCIAHQDYFRNGRIVVHEFQDRLEFQNLGSFIDGSPEDYIPGVKTPNMYRNPFLTKAMTELNMIDTIGYGIHSIHIRQARRFFPMPDFDLSEKGVVKVTIHGKRIDDAYSQILIKQDDLPLEEILALDRVQKHIPLPDDMIKQLRRKGFVTGRKQSLKISTSAAASTGKVIKAEEQNKVDDIQAEYSKQTPSQDDEHFCNLIIEYLERHGRASRKEIDQLLLDKFSDSLSAEQQSRKISNLLTRLRRQGVIVNGGAKKKSTWRLDEIQTRIPAKQHKSD